MHSSLLAVFPQGPPTFKPQQVWRSWRQQGESGGPPVGLHLTGADSVPLTGRGPGVGWSWPGQRPARESSPRASLSQGRPKGPPAGSELRCQEGDMREQSLVGRHLLPPMGGVSSSACHAQRQIRRAWACPRSTGTRPLTERTWEGRVFAARLLSHPVQ